MKTSNAEQNLITGPLAKLARAHRIATLGYLLSASIALAYHLMSSEPIDLSPWFLPLLTGLMLTLAGMHWACKIALVQGMPWARKMTAALLFIAALSFPFGTLLAIYGVIHLIRLSRQHTGSAYPS